MAGPQVILQILGDPDGALEASEQVKAKIKEITSTVEAMGRNMNAHSKKAVEAWRAEAREAELALRFLNATSSEHEKLSRIVTGVESNVTVAGQKFAMATRQMSYGFEAVARTGKLAGEAGRQLISTGAEMALMFGGAGPIVGAIGIAGLAIFSLFDRIDKRAEESAKKLRDEFDKMLGTTSRVTLAESLTGKASELIATERLLADLRAQLGTTPATRIVQSGADVRSVPNEDRLRIERQITEAQGQQFRIEAEMAVLQQRDLVLAQQEGEQRVRDLEITRQQREQEERIADARRRQLEFVRETAQLRERLQKELFGTDVVGRAREGAAPTRLADTFKIAGPLKGVDMPEFPMPDISPIQLYAGEVARIGDEMIKLPSIAQTAFGAIAGLAGGAFDALVMGGDASIRNLKKLFGEPIVAHLRSKAIEEFVLGSTELVRLNLPKAGGHFRNAALATAGAGLVGRIAGVGAPGGGFAGGGGGGAGGFTGVGAQLGATRSEQIVKMEILVVQQTPDGRTIARHTQHVQRLKDLDQPLRVVL